MRFGICTSVDNAADARAAGFEFVEELVPRFLQGHLPDAEWAGEARVAGLAVPLIAANSLLPPTMKVTGPEADLGALKAYMARVLARAARSGIRTVVFGSGARAVPEGFPRDAARQQIVDFIAASADLAQQQGIMLVAEHLNRGECNIINSLDEAMGYVRDVNHPNFLCLADSYHFWLENEPLDSLRAAMPWIRHVHVADVEGRLAPGETGKNDYRPFFRVLKEGGYAGPIAVESFNFDIPSAGPRVREFLDRQWAQA